MTDSKVARNSDKGLQVDCETHVEAPVTMNGREKCSETQIPNRDPPEAKTQAESTTPRYHERKLGVWTLYFPVSDDNSSRSAIPSLLNLASISRNARNVQRFLAETFFLGPYAFVLYLVVLSLSRAMPSVQLYSNSKIISLAEQTFSNPTERTLAIAKFKQAFITYAITMVVGWVTRKLHTYTRAILEQRVTIHFTKRILSVRSRLDLSSVEDPAVQSLMDRATQSSSNAWAVLDGLADIVAVSSQAIALFSTLRSLLGSREDAKLLGLTYLLPPLLSELHWLRGQFPFYAIITNTDCLRMSALVSLGCNSSYRKEVLGGGLESHIDSAYAESMSRLGDALKQDPEDQLSDRRLLDYSDIFDIFDPVPLFVYAWNNLRGHSDLSMSSLVMMQQAANSMHAVVWRVVYRGKNLSDVFKNLSGLYEALETKPRFVDGHVSYPDEEHSEQKGMGIEFRNVNFEYPSSGKPALANMSFTIAPGQLCVIVGENGCGKSTTIGLITRLYDCNSGEVLIDGRPVRDYKVSTVRAAANIMYQDYHHLPLTIRENILLGRPNSKNPTQEIEEAAKLGGAYDFVQKLPRKFETNLEPLSTGFPSWSGGGNSADKYKTIVETEKSTKLSGGEWQRLALSRTFMKNSEKTRLLCYDEPSASLDPKAEYEIFERLRKLRGEKTMIFVTHRFGYLTRHADLILYVKEGSVVEQGTHTSLLAQGGEYAKVYNIQSQAFSDSPGE